MCCDNLKVKDSECMLLFTLEKGKDKPNPCFGKVSLTTNKFVLGDNSLINLWDISVPKRQVFRGNNCVATLLGHSKIVQDAAFVKDFDKDKFLVSVSLDSTMILWNLEDRKHIARYKGHNWPVLSVAVNDLNTFIATGSVDMTARLWTFEYKHPLRIFLGHRQAIHSVCFHPNSQYVASGSADMTIRMWSVADGRCVRLLVGHETPVHCVKFSPNGLYLASAGEDKVFVWDLTSSKTICRFKGHESSVRHMQWSEDSTQIISADENCIVKKWNVADNENSTSVCNFKIPATRVLSVEKDSETFVCCAYNNPVQCECI